MSQQQEYYEKVERLRTLLREADEAYQAGDMELYENKASLISFTRRQMETLLNKMYPEGN